MFSVKENAKYLTGTEQVGLFFDREERGSTFL
jgi:hypothetical protein